VPTTGAPSGKEPPATPLTCAQLRNAQLQSDTARLPDHPAGATGLTDGRWSGDGVEIELQAPCGIGDLTGDGVADALGVVKITAGGTGHFYALVAWRGDYGTPVLAATAALGDRTPVTSVSVDSATRQATVVYLTRGDDEPAAIVTIIRTAVYRVAGTALTELRHHDAPYTP
jgi:hypothetical protein